MESGRLQRDHVEKYTKACQRWVTMCQSTCRLGRCAHRAVFLDVRLVASCATVMICADVTGR